MDRRVSISTESKQNDGESPEATNKFRKPSFTFHGVTDSMDEFAHLKTDTIPEDSILVYAPRQSRSSIAQSLKVLEEERSHLFERQEAQKILADYGRRLRRYPRANREIPPDVIKVATYLNTPAGRQISLSEFREEKQQIRSIRPLSAAAQQSNYSDKYGYESQERSRVKSAPARGTTYFDHNLPIDRKMYGGIDAEKETETASRLEILARPKVTSKQLHALRLRNSIIRTRCLNNQYVQRLKMSSFVNLDARAYHERRSEAEKYRQLLEQGKYQLEQESLIIDAKVRLFCDDLAELTLETDAKLPIVSL